MTDSAEVAAQALKALGAPDSAHFHDLESEELLAVAEVCENEVFRRGITRPVEPYVPPRYVGSFPRPLADRGCGCACNFGGFCGGCGHAGCGLR